MCCSTKYDNFFFKDWTGEGVTNLDFVFFLSKKKNRPRRLHDRKLSLALTLPLTLISWSLCLPGSSFVSGLCFVFLGKDWKGEGVKEKKTS